MDEEETFRTLLCSVISMYTHIHTIHIYIYICTYMHLCTNWQQLGITLIAEVKISSIARDECFSFISLVESPSRPSSPGGRARTIIRTRRSGRRTGSGGREDEQERKESGKIKRVRIGGLCAGRNVGNVGSGRARGGDPLT